MDLYPLSFGIALDHPLEFSRLTGFAAATKLNLVPALWLSAAK
jgi:hypothetical protein